MNISLTFRGSLLAKFIAVILVSAFAVISFQMPASAAPAAAPQGAPVTYQTALEQTQKSITEGMRSDPDGFAVRKKLFTDSPDTTELLDKMSFGEVDAQMQIDFFSAATDTPIVKGLIYGAENGLIEVVEVNGQSTMVIGQEKDGSSVMAMGDMPRCASAWAAFISWFLVTYPYCAAVTTLGVWWGFACAGLVSLGSVPIDFNAGC